ncbi:MAG: transketolase [Candidatus Omnitrophica bacterium]|nr:transketolase [Candidatus Omnitrophota bacterium]
MAKNKISFEKEPINKKLAYLRKKANWVRRRALEMAVSAGAGHVASSFSCADILVTLYYGGVLKINPGNSQWVNRDRFILSKGQAALALYPILADLGFFPRSKLMTFGQDGSDLGGLAENNIPGVEALTGSLGYGLSITAGMALSAKIDRKKYRCFTLLGDGECQEGSIWEAAMFAGHRCLNNLIAIIDVNNLSATDFLKNYLDLAPLKEKWESFGWEVEAIDGHSCESLLSVLTETNLRRLDKPLAILASTVKGKGVSFMENKPIWHYRIPVGRELTLARKELLLKKEK